MKKLKYIGSICRIAAVILLVAICGIKVKAEDGYELQQITADDKQITAYIAGGEKTQQIAYQIAMTPCDQITFGTISDMGEKIHTIILMDNSLSISEENQVRALEFLRQYIQAKGEREEISIAVFGEDIQFLQQNSTDEMALLTAVNEIEFHNQDTYLTDFLYDLLDEVQEDTAYTRFLVISDGVDNKAIGITKEELLDKLKENPHPVYALGHVYKENQTELENMFALSRITHGREFLLDDVSDINELAEQLTDDSDLICVKVQIPEALCDGSTRSSLFTIRTENSSYEVTAQVAMPFSIQKEEETVQEPVEEAKEEETEAVEEPVTDETDTEEPEITEKVEENVSESNTYSYKIIAATVIIAAGIGIYVIFGKRKNRKDKKDYKKPVRKSNERKTQAPPNGPVSLPKAQMSARGSERVSGTDDDQEGTVLLDGRYLLILRDQANPDKIFRYPLDTIVTVGRNVDKVDIAIDYSKTISGRHCEFCVKNNRFFINDLESVNHTYVNGVMINGETELFSGNKVRIGEVEFFVDFVPV